MYTYELKTDKQYQDAGYREEIIFELNSTFSDLQLNNEALQVTKCYLEFAVIAKENRKL